MNGTANTISIGTGVLVFLSLNGNVRYWLAYVVALLAAQGARSFVEVLGPPAVSAWRRWSRRAVCGLRIGLGDTFAGDALPFCVVAAGVGVVFVYGPWYGLPADDDEVGTLPNRIDLVNAHFRLAGQAGALLVIPSDLFRELEEYEHRR